jgi:hypothetical protein
VIDRETARSAIDSKNPPETFDLMMPTRIYDGALRARRLWRAAPYVYRENRFVVGL